MLSSAFLLSVTVESVVVLAMFVEVGVGLVVVAELLVLAATTVVVASWSCLAALFAVMVAPPAVSITSTIPRLVPLHTLSVVDGTFTSCGHCKAL